MTTIYMTKYALTLGIQRIEADPVDNWKYASQTNAPSSTMRHFLARHDFAFTAEEALKQAEEKRIKKLKSLDKQMKRLSALKFNIVNNEDPS